VETCDDERVDAIVSLGKKRKAALASAAKVVVTLIRDIVLPPPFGIAILRPSPPLPVRR